MNIQNNVLNHHKIKMFTEAIGQSIGLDQDWVKFILSDSKHKAFDFIIEDRNNGWSCFVPESATVAYPIWSCNADQTLIIVSDNDLYYADGYHDDADIRFLSRSHQGLLAHVFIHIYEIDEELDSMKEAAIESGFRYLDDLIQWHEESRGNYEKWEQNLQLFIADIDQRSF